MRQRWIEQQERQSRTFAGRQGRDREKERERELTRGNAGIKYKV